MLWLGAHLLDRTYKARAESHVSVLLHDCRRALVNLQSEEKWMKKHIHTQHLNKQNCKNIKLWLLRKIGLSLMNRLFVCLYENRLVPCSKQAMNQESIFIIIKNSFINRKYYHTQGSVLIGNSIVYIWPLILF